MTADPDPRRRLEIDEPSRPPPLSLLLGYGAMLPLALGATAAWLLPRPWEGVAHDATIVWGGAILAFLAGVRRGLSFRTVGGARPAQIATMLWLFLLGLSALLAPHASAAPALLMLGYGTMAVLDPVAARKGEAPQFFAPLRPVQMLVPLASLTALLARRLLG